MKNKLTEIFNLTKVTLDEQCNAISDSKDIYKERLEAIRELTFNNDDKYEQALLEIASISFNNNLPYSEIFAYKRIKRINDILSGVVDKVDYSKQKRLEF